jgi:RND family efflux transporter MFP subunit
MGRVQQVLVREGDSVRAAQTLVILDDATLKSASEQAEAAVKAAENQQIAAQTNADLAASTLARYKQLQEQKSVSPQEMDEVTRRAEAATAQVDALRAQSNAMKAQQTGARAMLSYTRVAAPFAGIVTARMADPGALASPGVPLMQIDSAGPLQLQASVGESAITFVHTGMIVSVSIDGMPGADPQGTVSQIVPAADASSHSFMVKIDLPLSSALRAGMYATAEIPTGARLAILAPRSAIVVRGSLPCAYVLANDDKAQLRYVTLGSAHGDAIEILSGLAANEKLVDDPTDRDLAGKRIEVQP